MPYFDYAKAGFVTVCAVVLAACGSEPVSTGGPEGDLGVDADSPSVDVGSVADSPLVDVQSPAEVLVSDDAGQRATPDATPDIREEDDGADGGAPDTGVPNDVDDGGGEPDVSDGSVELGTTPIFADMFRPQNEGGTVLERWQTKGYCQPTQALQGAFCIGDASGDAHMSTTFSTQGFTGLALTYVRVPNHEGGYDEGEYFVAEWSPDAGATWVEIEQSTGVEGEKVTIGLPPEAEGHPQFTLRFRVHANGGDGIEQYWLDDVVVTATVPVCKGQVWTEQFDVPFEDVNGEFVGGSEIFRIVPHQGELFAANTYWMDESSPWYGPGDQWAQLLRKTAPDAPWQEDYDLGDGVLRPEVLRSLTFNAPEPDARLLVAATFRIQQGTYFIDVWTRDDTTGEWTLTTPHQGPNPPDSHDISVRQVVVHLDSVTGDEIVILPVGTQGMLEGRYDPAVPGKIDWGSLIPVAFNERVMGMSIANGVVVVGAGNKIWHRQDGPMPDYDVVHDMEDLIPDGLLKPPMGTFRGMTTIDTPSGDGESLLFSWAPDYVSPGTIYRLDPDGAGYARVAETDIGDLLAADLGVPVWTSLCTYSYFLPVTHPLTGAKKHLGGCLNVIGGDDYPIWTGGPGSGHYKGGIYFVRHEDGAYTLREVAGRHDGIADPRDAVRAIARSPFAGDDQVYFGGHDSAGIVSTNLAWMFSAPLSDVLEVCAE